MYLAGCSRGSEVAASGEPSSGAKEMIAVKSLGPVEGQLTCGKDPPTFHLKTRAACSALCYKNQER